MTTTRRSVAARLACALAAVLTAGVALAGCGQPAETAPTGPVTTELEGLRSAQNGLYYPPYLGSQPAGPEDNSWALRIYAALQNRSAIELSPTTRTFFRTEALATSAITGRFWLLPFVTGGDREILPTTDAKAVRALRTPGGWFEDAGGSDPSARPELTAQAVAVLRTIGALTPADATASQAWLLSRLDDADLGVRAAAADALVTLGVPVPPAAATVRAPSTDGFASLTQDQRNTLLDNTYAYVRLRTDAGLVVQVDSADWQQVYDSSVATMTLPALYELIVVLKAAGVREATMDGASDRISANLLPDGSVRDPDAYTGDPLTTFYALALREMAGEALTDSALTAAVQADSAADRGSDALRKGVSAAVLSLTSGAAADPATLTECGRPSTVGEAETGSWQLLVEVCRQLGATVTAPQIQPWSVDGPETAVDAARLVNAVDRAALPAAARPGWLDPADLSPYLGDPNLVGGIGNFAEVQRAYLALGGTLTATQQAATDTVLAAARDCPDLPGLYRATGSDPGCDLPTTLSVWRLGKLAGHPYGQA